MRKLFITAIFLVIGISIYAQPKFTISDFEFYSTFEKETFLNYQKDTNNTYTYLSLFLLTDINSNETQFKNIKQSIEFILIEIQNSEKFKKGGEKAIKYIYKTIHDKFFDKYNPEAIFSEILTKKEYNCATASALYSIIFNELKIPFEVNYSENHVFLTAYPHTKPILVEATNPLAGTTVYPKSYIQNYVDYLRKSKLISQYEYENKPADIIFNEYFFKTDKGNINTLTGILYYNQSVFYFQKKDYANAYEMSLRASYFMKDYDKVNFLVLAASGLILQQDNFNSPIFFRVIGHISAFGNEMISKTEICNTIGTYYRNFAVKGQKDLLQKSNTTLIKTLKDTSLANQIKSIYYKELARLFYIKQEYDSSIVQIDSALQYNPEDNENQILWIDLFPKVMTKYQTPEDALLYVNNCFEKYSVLNKNTQACKLRTTVNLFTIINSFMENNFTNGEKLLSQFVKDYPAETNPTLDNDIFEKTIGEIAIQYYKKGQVKKAKEKAELGLKYLPNSNYLRKILSSLNN